MIQAPHSTPLDGELLAGKYEILRRVGEGGMGVVYEAMHRRLGERVAIKLLREQDRQSKEIVMRFEREARMAAKLRSVNVARIFDVDSLPDGTPFIVMEFLEGRDLDSELTERRSLPVTEAVGYLLQACSAVQEAHARGIVHRDLKPHNLFLCGDGPNRTLKLLDFGISKLSDGDSSVTATHSALGTPLYMSPEQIRSAKRADARSDIWSLGVILYELLTGTTPFHGENPTAVVAAITADPVPSPRVHRSDLPDALVAVIMRALEKAPERRFQTVEELARTLAPFGVSGTWVPEPLATSNPSNPATTPPVLTDAPTLLASGPPVDSASDANARPALTVAMEPPRPKPRALGLSLAALALASIAGLLWYALDGRAAAPEPVRTAAEAVPAPLLSSPVSPEPEPRPAVEPRASAEVSPQAGLSPPKTRPQKPPNALPSAPSKPGPEKPTPKPEAKDPGIPLTL
ncbi:MAG: protein kinase [Myxococcales bacterium]|nr:protein kinase [Myxococcales bacterium]